jgi:hypothetical protein
MRSYTDDDVGSQHAALIQQAFPLASHLRSRMKGSATANPTEFAADLVDLVLGGRMRNTFTDSWRGQGTWKFRSELTHRILDGCRRLSSG